MNVLQRRRMMSQTGGQKEEVAIILDIQDTSHPATLFAADAGYLDYVLSYMIIDGVKTNPVKDYQFSKAGLHKVRYKQNYDGGLAQPGHFSFALVVGDGVNMRIREIRIADEIVRVGNCNSIGNDLDGPIKVRLPKNLQTIADQTFRYCTNLRTIEIPAGVTDLGDWTFNLAGLDYVHLLPATPPSVGSNTFSANHKIYVGNGRSQASDDAILDLYLTDSDWSAYSSQIDTWYNYLNS